MDTLWFIIYERTASIVAPSVMVLNMKKAIQ